MAWNYNLWLSCPLKLWINKSQACRGSLSLHSLWLMQLYCCPPKKTKHHLLPQRALLPSQASVGLTLVGSSSSWQQPDTSVWFIAAWECRADDHSDPTPRCLISHSSTEETTLRLIQRQPSPRRSGVQSLRWTSRRHSSEVQQWLIPFQIAGPSRKVAERTKKIKHLHPSWWDSEVEHATNTWLTLNSWPNREK